MIAQQKHATYNLRTRPFTRNIGTATEKLNELILSLMPRQVLVPYHQKDLGIKMVKPKPSDCTIPFVVTSLH